MKKLPLGIQSLCKIIENDYLYVDKTKMVHQLISSNAYYFMARPRRFGKSLLVSTLEEIFNGNKTLFKDCFIGSSDYPFHSHPVLRIDFSRIPHKTSQELEDGLKRMLQSTADKYSVDIQIPTLQEGLENLLKQLSKINHVAVLVDEHDRPIIDHLNHTEIADSNRGLLKDFFGTLKSLDQHIKFAFVTGVSKFSQVSLFSGFNNLRDITLDEEYSSLMGYTKEELESTLHGHIEDVAKKRSCPVDAIYQELKEWYDGYRFSKNGAWMYNPFSTLNYLLTGEAAGYWYSTGTPIFLIDQIKKLPATTTDLSGSHATRGELLDIRDLQNFSLKALMWQTGYLTIKSYDSETSLYELDFPNREVRSAFFESLTSEFGRITPADMAKSAKQMRHLLEGCELNEFFKRMNIFFAKVSYQLFAQAREGIFHALFLGLLEGLQIKTRPEDPTNIGRIDLVVELDNVIYIFEFKIDKSAATALEQTRLKNYSEKYLESEENLAVVGVNFSTESNNISEWKGKLYTPSGAFIKDL